MLVWKKPLSKRINPMVLFFNFDNVSVEAKNICTVELVRDYVGGGLQVFVSQLREPTSGELWELGVKPMAKDFVWSLGKLLKEIVKAMIDMWNNLVDACTDLWNKLVSTIECKLGKHDVYWELEVRYSDSDHEHYLVGYCKDCGKRHTKGLYY